MSTCGFITNEDYPEAGFSPDGYTPERPIQVKCYAQKKHLDIVRNGFDEYKYFEVYAQLQFEIMVFEADDDDLVLYNPECESLEAFKVIRVPRNDKVIERFKELLNG